MEMTPGQSHAIELPRSSVPTPFCPLPKVTQSSVCTASLTLLASSIIHFSTTQKCLSRIFFHLPNRPNKLAKLNHSPSLFSLATSFCSRRALKHRCAHCWLNNSAYYLFGFCFLNFFANSKINHVYTVTQRVLSADYFLRYALCICTESCISVPMRLSDSI